MLLGGGIGMGGGAAGGNLLRIAGRAVTSATVTIQEPISGTTSPTATSSKPSPKANSSNHLVISSSGSSPFSTFNASGTHTTFGGSSDNFEWVSVDGNEDEKDQSFFGPVPSVDEVQYAALQQMLEVAPYSQNVRDRYAYIDGSIQVSSVGSDSDWEEPSPTRMLQSQGSNRVYDVFHLLQTEPLVQKMVIALSSDKTVCDAVMNNEVVRELKQTFYADGSNSPKSSDEPEVASENPNPAINIVRWIFEDTKARVMEVIENITKIANELFQPSKDERNTTKAMDSLDEKLKTSFLLSAVVLLIVVVSQAGVEVEFPT